VWQPGRAWAELVTAGMRAAEAKAAAGAGAESDEASEPASGAEGIAAVDDGEERSLSLLKLLDGYVPRSLVEPFLENTVLTVALLAIFLGTAMRSVKAAADEPGVIEALGRFEQVVAACFLIVVKMLAWLIEVAPIAIFLVIAGLVGGTDDLGDLAGKVGVYFATVMAALGVHALLYYPLSAWLVGGVSPRRYFGEGGGAILTGFSLNSSLATAPVTLRALERIGVSDSSARLSACIGTNFNNDGITLYEAITALFVAQAAGMELGLSAQIAVLLAVLSGSMGIAGIPN
jgi:Na+/H+-dicarboxylate symporter